MLSASEALVRLREGNRRFAADRLQHCLEPSTRVRRDALVAGQAPFAVILGCADSRVPAEIVFDQGLGDLFVIRVAGNIVAPSQIGSVEFAVEQIGTRLVVVLGHSGCGAVAAAIADSQKPLALTPHLRTIVDRIRPAVDAAQTAVGASSPETLLAQAVRDNIHASVRELIAGSPLLAQQVRDGDVMIVGAQYAMETGKVAFLADG
jgi:carbonic anhydrase